MSDTSAGGASGGQPLSRLFVRALLLSLAAGAIAAGYSLTIKSEYRATATLLLAPLPIQQRYTDAEDKAVESPASVVSFLMVKPLSVLDYRLVLMSDEIVDKVRKEFVRLTVDADRQGEGIRIEDVRQAMEVETRIMKQTVYDVVYQPVIELQFTATEPAVASALANTWAELAVELAAELSSKKKEGLIGFLKERFEGKETELDAAEVELEDLDTQVNIDALGQRLYQHEAYITQLQIDLSKLATMIARAEGQLTELANSLADVTEKETLRKALPDDAYWLLKAEGKPVDSSNVFETEQFNPVYVALRQQESTLRADLEGMLKEDAAKEVELQEIEAEVTLMRKALASHTRMRNSVHRKIETLSVQHSQLAVNYGAAELAEAENTPDLKLVSRAVPPESKVGPHRILLVLAALILGGLIAPIHFFVAASLRPYTRRQESKP